MTGMPVIRASVSPGEVRVALLQDDTLLDYRLERPARPEGLGDLHRARVYYTVLGEDREHRGTEAALRSARSHLRAELGHQIRMKFTPELQFEEDPGATSGERVDELLRQIHAQETTREGKPVTDEEAS